MKPSEEGGDEWEGEDEGLVIEEDKQEPKAKRELKLSLVTRTHRTALSAAAGIVKKSKQERIEEKKAKRREEEQKGKGTEKKETTALTAEEKLEQKRKAEEAQREADLQSAKELFGGMIGLLDDPIGNRDTSLPCGVRTL